MNKRFTILLILIFFLTFVFSQNDSIKSLIIDYDASKSTFISKGRKLLLDKFIEGDLKTVKNVKNYLIEIEDDEYFALYPDEYWFILYWTNEYKELSESIKQLDSASIKSYRTRIRPSDDRLHIKLREKSLEKNIQLKTQLQNAGLDAETKEMLNMHLDWLLLDSRLTNNTQVSLNERADKFLETYPSSEFNYFIKKHISYKLVPKNWGLAFEFFSGYGAYTGQLSNNFTNSIPIGIAFDITYKDFELYLRDYIGFHKSKKDFEYSLGTYEKGSGMMTILGEASLGYAVYNNDRFKISPSAGIGVMGISTSTKDTDQIPELEEISLDPKATFVLGLNFDIKLGLKNTPKYIPKTNYSFIRIRYGYSMPGYEKKYYGMTGDMHYISVGFGIMTRHVKRAY
ncbi:MAG: hypothetical protein CR968_00105 [Flavobacteriia bacterium]|nr:MAG: hypothetical protein CR968_00105 [Flavobacteriia bacterium]